MSDTVDMTSCNRPTEGHPGDPALAMLREWLVTGTPPHPGTPATATRLVEAAAEQRVAGLLHSVLPARAPGWPGRARARLRDLHHAAFARGAHQLAHAQQLLSLLKQAGVRALPMKGAAVAERLYGWAAGRPMGDVDLLALDEWPEAVRALERAGLRLRTRADHAWAFLDPATGGEVELHHSITSCHGLFPIDRNGLWERRRAGDSHVVEVPSPEDLLLQLCLHASFQSGLVLSLVQYLDIRRIFERANPDTDLLWAIAARAQAIAPLAAGLEAARAVVAAPVPEELRVRLASALPVRLRRWLAGLSATPLALVEPSRRSIARTRWSLMSGRRRQLLVGTVVPREPGSRLWSWRDLPSAGIRATTLALRWAPSLYR